MKQVYTYESASPLFYVDRYSKYSTRNSLTHHLKAVETQSQIFSSNCPVMKWATTRQTNQMTSAPSEDSDQPGHPSSLIRIFTVCMQKQWVLSYPWGAQRRLIRLDGPGWSESWLGAEVILLVLSCVGSNISPFGTKTNYGKEAKLTSSSVENLAMDQIWDILTM